MKIDIPDISKQIYKQDVLNVIESGYSIIGPLWTNSQLEWLNNSYKTFKDHDKFLIVSYLVKQTLDFYSRNFVKLDYENFYSKNFLELEKFNVIEVAKNIDIPKESVRRKLIELEEASVIKRLKKKLIISSSSYKFIKPIKTTINISRILSVISKLLLDEKILLKKLDSKKLEKVIKDNFSHVWKIWYELQIPTIISYKQIFQDVESFHIFGACVVNQHFHAQKDKRTKTNRLEFISSIFIDDGMFGLSAMSISDITGIPRSTVVRKLKKLVEKNFLSITVKKHYKLTGKLTNRILPIQKKLLNQLSDFSAKIFNLAIL